MASKKDWNDWSDDDSDDANHHLGNEHQEQPEELPSLNKIVSSPLPDRRSANQQDNLKKLQNCNHENIWLFVPLFNQDRVEEIDQYLKSLGNLKQVLRFFKGWSVLTSKEQAKTYIIQGKKFSKFFIKFYFSNKNEANQTKNSFYKNVDSRTQHGDYENKKIKYVQKSSKNKQEGRNVKSPQGLRRIVSQNDTGGSFTPKYPNYGSSQQRKYQESESKKNYIRTNFKKQQIRQKDTFNKDSRSYKQRYVTKDSLLQNSQKKNEQLLDSTKKKYVAKGQQPQKTETFCQMKNKPEIQKVQDIQQKVEEIRQKSNNETEEKKPKKKKNKKGEVVKDSNNPFSLLNGI